MYSSFPTPSDTSTAESEAKLISNRYLALLQDSVPDEDPIIALETISSRPRQSARTLNTPLPALAKEVLWYSHEKNFNETHNISYSPFIRRYKRLSASTNRNKIGQRQIVPESSFTLWIEKDLQDAKHKTIAQIVSNQVKKFENVHVNHGRL